ncbi:Coronin-1B [Taenia solium]|eukprot:TsM_000033000 transcript=TsM_000033000 gene=TsM_000033000
MTPPLVCLKVPFSMFVRKSKFKHIIGKPNKKEFCYDEIRITKSSWDSTFCSVNPKYLAIITEAAGGGAFLVLPIEKYGRVGRDAPLVAGHRAAVLDIEWCPHNDDLIASGSEDCTAKVWQIPEGGLQPETNLTTPVADLVAHQRRVGLVKWHPTAEYVLLTAGTSHFLFCCADNIIFIWNVSTEEKLITINFPDMVLSASFNWNGSRLVTTCKDRHTRIIDPRKGTILKENICHQGTKPQQAIYLKDGRIFTTGFSPMSERQFALWAKDDVSKRLVEQDLDISNGIMFPFYDPDSNLIFLCGKGDSSMRYFEVTDDDPYIFFIDTMTSSDPQRGIGWMPKRGLNVNQNEIARFYKLHTRGFCEVIPFTVPRKSVLYQDDLYPDTVGDTPALSADEWMSGKDADPILISLKDGFVSGEADGKKNGKLPSTRPKLTESKLGGAHHQHQAPRSNTTSAATDSVRPSRTSSNAVSASGEIAKSSDFGGINPEEVQQLLDDMRKMKIIIKGHERRIKHLEEQLKGGQ